MSKKKQHIDDFFADRLKGQPLPLDGSEWDRLADAIEPQKRKRRFLWWWLMLIPIALVAIWLLPIRDAGDAQSNTQEQVGEQEQPKEDLPSATEPQTLPIDADASTDDESTVESPQLESPADVTNTDIAQELPDSPIDEAVTESPVEEPATETPVEDPITDADIVEIEPIASTTDADEVDTETGTADENRKAITAEPALKSRPFDGFNVALATPLDSLPEKATSTRKFVPKPSLALIIGLSVDGNVNSQAIRTLDSNYMEMRNRNEFNAYTPQINLTIETEWKGFRIGTGLSYVQRKQSLGKAYSSNPEIRLTLYDSIPYIDLQGRLTWLPWNYRDSVVKRELVNPTYHSVQLPISFGSSYAFGKKFSLGYNMLLQANYTYSTKGTVATNLYRINSISSQHVNAFNLTGGVQLNVGYYINPMLELRLNATLQRDLLNMSTVKGVDQRFTLYGTGLGIYYKLR